MADNHDHVTIRARVVADVQSTLERPSESTLRECNKVLEEIAAERGVSPAQVLRDAIEQMRKAHG